MGLQRTPPKSAAAASLLPRPLPPAYPEGEAPPVVEAEPAHAAEPTSSRMETEARPSARASGRKRSIEHVDESDAAATAAVSGVTDVPQGSSARNAKRQSFRPVQSDVIEPDAGSIDTFADAPELINADLEGTGLVTEAPPLPAAAETSSAPVRPAKRRSVAGPSSTSTAPATAVSSTSERRTRQSEAPQKIADTVAASEDTDFGKHYGLLLQALEVAVRKGANKWTAKDFKQCFPTISASPERAQIFDAIWERTAALMRETMLDHAKHILVEYQTGPGLLRLHQAVQQARADQEKGVRRPDAWRPNLTPHALVAATNLPQHDETYTKLRQEFVELTESNATLAQSIENKLERCRAIEGETRESIEQLEKTVKVLDGFPTAEMQEWMTDVAGNLEGQRGP